MYYNSSTKGKMLIADMTDAHLLNAIKKLDRTIIHRVDKNNNTINIIKGCSLPEYQDLINELAKRNMTINDIRLGYIMADG